MTEGTGSFDILPRLTPKEWRLKEMVLPLYDPHLTFWWRDCKEVINGSVVPESSVSQNSS